MVRLYKTLQAELSLQDMVEGVLFMCPAARDNDNILCWRLYGIYFGLESINEKTEGVPSMSQIERKRRYVQNTLNKYPPTSPEVIDARKKQTQIELEEMGYTVRKPNPIQTFFKRIFKK